MSILRKDWIVEFTPGTPGVAGTTGVTAQAGYWTDPEPAPVQNWNTYIPPPAPPPVTGASIRIANFSEVRLLWPWLTTNCQIEIQILKGTMTTQTIGLPLYLFTDAYGHCVAYLTIYKITVNGKAGISYCYVTGSPGTLTPIPNPAYTPNWEYSGQIPGC